jgi:hypothetical protein
LKYCVEKGLLVSKVHRVVKYHQSPWLKKYIDFNTDKRAKTKNAFEKDLFKLFINVVYGKTMKNVRNRMNFELINDDPKQAKKWIAKCSFKRAVRFNEDLYGHHFHKTKVMLNKPVYVGCSILAYSKLDIARFHYDYIKVKYGNKAKLLLTDTDSLAYVIETEDIHKDMSEEVPV